ncbi:hypothetical protein Ddye_014125 [Dipteronia dyeriana]|uniref:KIB1-4 beta-propeller domain-containing protein n=1 Tax=Dipteronia dyeriana TaxID=168575 RepID=A0AAD9X7L8_9ROSI|nr:hypothetical protein Ddye_014125 [Dipteronia dyeriana]
MAKKADWSGLDDLALEEITGRMTLYRDFAAFRMVCTSWQSSLQDFKFKYPMPWLMLQPKKSSNLHEFFIFPQVEQVQGGTTQQHLALPENDIFQHVEEEQVQGGITQHFYSFSSKGWLLDFVEDIINLTHVHIGILHPFSGAQIKLPQWPKNLNLFIFKFVLSSNPLSTLNYTVMILHGGRPGRLLSYSKPGDKTWTTINTDQDVRLS